MIKFSNEKVKLLHQLMAEATGGSVGVRDEGLLESAIEVAFATQNTNSLFCNHQLVYNIIGEGI